MVHGRLFFRLGTESFYDFAVLKDFYLRAMIVDKGIDRSVFGAFSRDAINELASVKSDCDATWCGPLRRHSDAVVFYFNLQIRS